MTVSYRKEWNPETGTCYQQRITLTPADLRKAGINFKFSPDYKTHAGKNVYNVYYGNSNTGACIAHDFFRIPGYEKQLSRIISANTVIYIKINK